MMDNKITQGTKVELKAGFEDCYDNNVLPGARAYVEKTKTDADNYDLIYVKWDRDHWRYDGQRDGWTYASHFKVVEEPNVVEEMIAKVKARTEEEGFCEHCGKVHRDEEDPAFTEFFHTLQEAFDIASDSDAFLMLAVTSEPSPYDPHKRIKVPVMLGKALDDDASTLIEMHIVQLAIGAYRDYIAQMDKTLGGKDEPGRPEPSDNEDDRS